MAENGTKHTLQNLFNWSWDDTKKLLGIGMVGWDGTTAQFLKTDSSGNTVTTSKDEQTKITESGSYTYVAKAPVGTAQASALWKAYRIDETSGLVILFADGNTNYDNVATDLTALTYS